MQTKDQTLLEQAYQQVMEASTPQVPQYNGGMNNENEIQTMKSKQLAFGVPYEASYKTVEGMNSGYLTLKAVAKLKGFIDSNRKVVIPKGYTVISDPYGLYWNIVKD